MSLQSRQALVFCSYFYDTFDCLGKAVLPLFFFWLILVVGFSEKEGKQFENNNFSKSASF